LKRKTNAPGGFDLVLPEKNKKTQTGRRTYWLAAGNGQKHLSVEWKRFLLGEKGKRGIRRQQQVYKTSYYCNTWIAQKAKAWGQVGLCLIEDPVRRKKKGTRKKKGGAVKEEGKKKVKKKGNSGHNCEQPEKRINGGHIKITNDVKRNGAVSK